MKKISFLLTENQYNDLKGLLYDCADNPLLDNYTAEFVIKMLEENNEEYWAKESIQLSGYEQ